MKLNRKWLMVIALVLSLTMATAGTLAYLTDSDKDVNTMTLGRVEIVQNEQERTEDGELDEFTQDKPLLPAYFEGNSIPWADEDEWPVPGDQAWKVVEDNEGVIDKFVTVTNTGKTDAYVRTIIAYEGDETYGPEGAYIHVVHNATNVDPDIKVYTIDGVKYTVYVYTYPEVLAADETTIPSLKQVYMDKSATNKVVEQYGATYDILVLSQAMQAQGFNDAETALNEGFGKVTAENVVKWMEETGIGSRGDKNDTNNPPEAKLPTTSWLDNSDTSWYDASKNEYSISTAAELAGLSKLVNEQGVTFRGKTVTLTNSVDLGDHLWTPVGQTGAAQFGAGQFGGTFDGGNNTISNLYVDSTSKTAKYYSSGLFGWLNTATVKNVKVDGAVINANKYAGVIAGYMESISACTIFNCSVRDAKITAVHTNDDNCGDKIGVIVGYAGNAGSVVKNCSATKCTVAAGRDAGQIAGAARTEVVTGCTATNVTVSATEGCTGANINEDIIGRQLN